MADGLDDTPICPDQLCPFWNVQSNCYPPRCRAEYLTRQREGAIYVLDPEGDAFLGLLPGVRQ